MDIITKPIYTYCKMYIWRLFHSLINFFFNVYIKKKYAINENCYLFVKYIGDKNIILINDITSRDTLYFTNLHIEKIKFILNTSDKIPRCNIAKINIEPKIFNFDNLKDTFKIWHNAYCNTTSKINILDEIINECNRYATVYIGELNIEYKFIKIYIKNIRYIKNSNKSRFHMKEIKLFYRNIYIIKIRDLRISHDSDTNNINIYGNELLFIINNYVLKYDVLIDIQNLFNQFNGEKSDNIPNVYFNNIHIHISIINTITCRLSEVMFEKHKLKLNVNIKLWKKEIFWIKQFTYNMLENSYHIENVRMRIFPSTGDKLFKTLRPIYKKYSNTRKSKNIINTCYFCKYPLALFNNDYLKKMLLTEEQVSGKIDTLRYDSNYITNYVDSNICTNICITTFRIDFTKDSGIFIFNNFKYYTTLKGTYFSTTRWLFKKNNKVYLDAIDKKSILRIELRDNSLFIYPYRLYLNLDIDVFDKTFTIFNRVLNKINNIFSTKPVNIGYIFEYVYIHSNRIRFNYISQKIKILRLLGGKYTELINILNLTNMDFMLRDIAIWYPMDSSFIVAHVIRHLINDIIENNFEELMNSTPLGQTYTIQQEIKKIPYLAEKCAKINNML